MKLRTDERGQSSIVGLGMGLFAFIFLLSAPISAYFLGKIFLEAEASSDWPAVEGKLIRAQVGERGLGRCFADVLYTYRVDNASFTGTRIRASDGDYDRRDGAVQAIRGLTVGEQLPVFYNPANPRQAVLQAGAGFQEYALMLVPVVMFVLGLWRFRLWRRTLASAL